MGGPRVLRRAAALGSAAVLGLWVALVPLVAAADPVAPTVTFTSTGVPPVSCGSQPNVTSLALPEGTAFLVENRIGESAWVRVGDEAVLEVADGAGALLTLAVGQHDVRMVPSCLVTGEGRAQKVVVTVSPATAASGDPSASSAPGATPTPDVPSGEPTATGSEPVASVPAGPIGTPAVVPAGTEVVVDPGAPPATLPPLGHSEVLAATAVQLPGGGNPKGVRLLAIVAAICVLGVTAAIIRSIVRLSP
jgi:hypothetical protein